MRAKQTSFQRGNATKAALIIGGAFLIVAALAYIYFFGSKIGSKQNNSSVSNQQKETQRQEVFNQIVAQNGYAPSMPQDLILNPQVHATTTVVTDKKTGVITTRVAYTENRPLNQVLDIYVPTLKSSGWTVAPADPKKPLEIDVSKNGFSATFTLAPKGPVSTLVTIQFASNN